MKTKAVTGWAGLWLRVDAEDHTAGFDNMGSQQIKGTTLWAPYSVVLDVPNDAVAIYFGSVMAGAGQCWVADLSLDPVDSSRVAATGGWMGPDYKHDPMQPQNLGFAAAKKSAAPAPIAGWRTGTNEWDQIHLDPSVTRDGRPTAVLQNSSSGAEMLALFQEIQAAAFRGKRVQFRAYVKTTDKVSGGPMVAIPGGGQWVVAEIPQVIEKNKKFVKDTREWKPVAAVVNVPKWANCIQFGVQLNGPGKVWVSDSSFKVVDPKTTPLTEKEPEVPKAYWESALKKMPASPVNLDFTR